VSFLINLPFNFVI